MRTRAQRTDQLLQESDWEKIYSLIEDLPYPNPCFAYKDRERMILNRLHGNGNQPISAGQLKLYRESQAQIMNQTFSWHKMPYRLLQVESGHAKRHHFKIFIVRGGRQ